MIVRVMTEHTRVGIWQSAELDSGNIVDLPLLNSDNLRNELLGISSCPSSGFQPS